jgi:bifunctional UDP-N-acetylglucosamine pyrophosphorylase / glucosamine-1-phosphate N-acetyltransferase
MKNRASIILAAGKGTRMKSDLPKVMHKVGDKAMVNHVLAAAEKAGIAHNIVVVGHMADTVREELCHDVTCALQEEQKGTGHAVLITEELIKDKDSTVIVLSGDAPLITAETIKALVDYHENTGVEATVLTAVLENPFAYGRIVRDEEGYLEKIVEEKDATDEEKLINEINTGTYCFTADKLFDALHHVGNDNSQGEYYLTDVLGIIRENGGSIRVMAANDPTEVLGVNTLEQLAEAEKIYSQRTK